MHILLTVSETVSEPFQGNIHHSVSIEFCNQYVMTDRNERLTQVQEDSKGKFFIIKS